MLESLYGRELDGKILNQFSLLNIFKNRTYTAQNEYLLQIFQQCKAFFL